MAVITITHKIGGTLTDADSTPVLSSEDASYGVKRSDTSAVVVADGTAMTKTSTGTYTYTVTEPEAGLTYIYSVELTYDGVTSFYVGSLAGSSSSTSSLSGLGCDFTSLRREVGRYLGFDATVGNWSSEEVQIVNDCITEGLRMFYHPEPLMGYAYEWSFLKPEAIIETTAPYITGTVTVSSGVVTLSGGTFPSWAANGVIDIASNGRYYVSTRDSSTQITLDDTSVTDATARAYTLYQYAYDLPSDFGAMAGPLTMRDANNYDCGFIEQRGEHQVRNWISSHMGANQPQHFAMKPASFNVSLGTRWEVIFWPLSNASYHLSYNYKIDPGQLNESQPYPAGGSVHASTIRAACLAAAEQKENDMIGPKTQEFKSRLLASLKLDAEGMQPDSLGYMHDTTNHRVVAGYNRQAWRPSTTVSYGS